MPDIIICPNCKNEIELTEAISAQLRSAIQKEFEAAARKRERDLAARESALRSEEAALAARKAEINTEVTERLNSERARLSEEAVQKARESVGLELRDAQQQLQETRGKLLEAQQAELELRKQRRELEDAKQQFDLTLARQLDEERAKVRDAALREAAEDRKLKDAEKDKLMTDLRQQIEELRRKSEQGSQQLQGEVMEIELESLLRNHFTDDIITPVSKGVHGADVTQLVRDPSGTDCGMILWESKRTKNWSDAWLPKLRDDQRAAQGQFAVLMSVELPKGLTTFGCVEGVWVTSRPCALGLATALRAGLIEVASVNRAKHGKQTKMELLYDYLSGSEFRHRIEAIVEAFVTLRDELEAEKRAIQRIWAKREKQLARAVTSTVGFYGDLEGIIGKALPRIKRLELPAPPNTAIEGTDNSR